MGGATSSASTKLIHGGLRYLEHFEFRLVRRAQQIDEGPLPWMPRVVVPLVDAVDLSSRGDSDVGVGQEKLSRLPVERETVDRRARRACLRPAYIT